MKYCTKCWYPTTKPFLTFDKEGVCSACNAYKKRDEIDWDRKEKEFDALLIDAAESKAPYYDVVVPVSGGKDSIAQVHKLLGKGLRILAVSVDYGIKTEIGKYNLNLIGDIANLMVYTPDRTVSKNLMEIGFTLFGDPDIMSHALLYAYPLHVAKQFKIPLVLFGENPAELYYGDKKFSDITTITEDWFYKYVVDRGKMSTIKIKSNFFITNFKPYTFPNNNKSRAIFCSSYFPWDSEVNLKIAKTHGFKSLDTAKEGTYRNYVGVDEVVNRIHQYIKLLKFGYGRATDHACEDIRNGHLTRTGAKFYVLQNDMMTISEEYIKIFCEYIGIDRCFFDTVLNKFRNKNIWRLNFDNTWYIPNYLEYQEIYIDDIIQHTLY